MIVTILAFCVFMFILIGIPAINKSQKKESKLEPEVYADREPDSRRDYKEDIVSSDSSIHSRKQIPVDSDANADDEDDKSNVIPGTMKKVII